MTLIVGVTHDNFVVMAADGEEANPTSKRSVSKLPHLQNKHGANLVIGGAGPDSQVETISELLFDQFDDVTGKNVTKLKERFRETIKKHYKDHVLSFPSLPEREDNDFSLLIGISVPHENGKFEHLLLTSESGTLRHVRPYHAIGLGKINAKALLDEYLSLRPPLLTAFIAMYVVYKIKSNTTNVGKQTEAWKIEDGKLLPIMQPYIDELEGLFGKYEYAKVRHFLTIFGTNTFPGVDPRHDEAIQAELVELREKCRNLVNRITRN